MKAEQLRKSILQLAIQGKLVPQDPADEPASVLLERIRAEKQSLIKQGKIKKDKGDSVIFKGDDNCYYEKTGSEVKNITDEIPFDIPDSWCWVRINNYVERVTDFVASGSFATLRENVKYYKENNYALLVKTQDFANSFTKNLTYTDQHGYEFLSNSNLFGGELILSNVGSIGKVFIVPTLNRPATLAPNAIMVRCVYNACVAWLFYLFKSNFGLNILLSIASATAIKKFNKTDFKTLLIPIPPIAEQKRIVAEIEKFEPLIAEYDKLEQQATKLDGEIYDKLKKSILQYAIQGKLVPQDSNDEPAAILLERIRAEKKAQLGKKYVESYIYKGDDNCYYEHINGKDVDITEDIPFDLPDSWAWSRWGELSDSIQYGYNAPAKQSGRIKMIRISDIHENQVMWENVPYCDIAEEDISTYLLKENDILFARTGGTVGKSFLVQNIKEEAIYAGYLIRTRYNSKLIPQYFKYFMESPLYWSQLRNGTIATAQPNCNGQTLSKMIVPVPPLAEQKRIVEKIDEIFAKL